MATLSRQAISNYTICFMKTYDYEKSAFSRCFNALCPMEPYFMPSRQRTSKGSSAVILKSHTQKNKINLLRLLFIFSQFRYLFL